MDVTSPFLTRPETAARLHVSEMTIRRYGKLGLLEERRIGPKLIRITVKSIEALERGNTRREAA